jgi:ArsR family transcriptional regulator, arsenate/arsenite/antimonite-responsive transcriptional repressor
MDKELQTADRVLKALADPTRLRIVGLLRTGEICVCHIYDSLKISQPKASRHLAYLRRAGVVRADKRGLWVYYTLATELTPAVRALLDAAVHCTTLLATTARDVQRLEKTTGCPAGVPHTDSAATCCAPTPSRVS